MSKLYPKTIPNIINGEEVAAASGATFPKISPHDGSTLATCANSNATDIERAIQSAKKAQPAWAAMPPVSRGALLHKVCNLMEERQRDIANIVAMETGKSPKEAFGEVGGAILLGRFYAGEGQRLYGRTTTSGTTNKYAMTVRQPCGITGLIVAANTPIANVAWKTFPALICGNAAILKAPEDAPITGWIFAKIFHDAGLPAGVLNLIQGLGKEAGAPIVESPDISVVSFTGSTPVGRWIAETAGKRLAKVSLELGGKNPFVVCDDADIDHAVKWACLSAFSNAGQRCAAGSRMIIVENVYESFKKKFVEAAEKLKVGNSDQDDFGPVINEKQLNNMLLTVAKAVSDGAKILTGGKRLTDAAHEKGCYIAPTIIEGAKPDAEISMHELFGPIACLYKVKNYQEAFVLAHQSDYALTACIHTKNFDRATHFTQNVKAGVAVVNAGTYGSEPHMPFGGPKASGNGSREPGTEALDIYSDLKDIYLNITPEF